MSSPSGAQPVLEIQPAPDELHLRWPEMGTSWILEEVEDPAQTAAWTPTTEEASLIDGYRQVVVSPVVAPRFWRLRSETATQEVWVVDEPTPGDPAEFTEIPPAFTYLNEHLAANTSGTVILATNRELAVDRLVFQHAITMRVADGYSPKLRGPGDGNPMVVDAFAACGLVGLTVGGSGGLSINAYDDLNCQGNQATSISILMSEGAAMETAAVSGRDGSNSQKIYNVNENVCSGLLTLNLGSSLDAILTANDNQADTLALNMQSYMNGEINLSKNLVDSLSAKLKLNSSIQAQISDHVNLSDFSVEGLLDNGKLDLDSNEGSKFALALEGVGEAYVRLSNHKFNDGRWAFGAGTNWDIESESEEYGKFAFITAGDIEVNATGFTATASAQFNAEAGIRSALYFKGTTKFDGDFNLAMGGDLVISFEDIQAKAYAQFAVEGDLFDADIKKGRFDTGLSLQTEFVGLSFNLSMGGGGPVSFGKYLDVNLPELPNRGVSILGAHFEANASATFYHDIGSGGGFKSLAVRDAENRAAMRALAAGGFVLKDLTFDGPEAGAPAIAMTEISEPITISGCHFAGSVTAVSIGLSSGPITVEKCTFEDGGLTIMECSGAITVSNNQMNVSNPPGALFLYLCGNVDLTDSTVNAPGLFAIYAAGDVDVNASGNTIDGMILAGGGEFEPARISFSNNSFTPTSMISDATGRAGGLPKDPMAEGNSGLIPSLIDSLIDFDGNGCADYPPERNNKKPPEFTECNVEGIAPP